MALAPEPASQRVWARLTAWTGLGVLVCLLLMTGLESLIAGGCAHPAMTLKFELGDFGLTKHLLTGVCGAERSLAIQWVNFIDVGLFIPLYAALLIFAARMLAGRWLAPDAVIACAAVLVAAAADWTETITQLRITFWVLAHRGWDFAPMADFAALVVLAAKTKFLALCVFGVALAFRCFLNKPELMRFTAATQLLPLGGAAAGFANIDMHAGTLAACTAVAWGALVRLAVKRLRAPKFSS